MTEYRVVWEIDVEAESPVEAARKAKTIQKRVDSIAHVYVVNGEVVDLDELDEHPDV